MQNLNVISLYESGLRGRPVARIGAGDLADPYAKSTPWQRVTAAWATMVDIVRETRALQAKLLEEARFTHID